MSGQVWALNSLGGYMYADNLSSEFRQSLQSTQKFRQFCDVKNAAGKHRGQVFHWDIFNDINQQGGTLVETNTMPEGQMTITQGTLTITEYGQAAPYSGKLEALGKVSIRQPLMKALKNDASKAFDVAAHDQFNLTKLRVVPTGGTATDSVVLTTDGTATATNNVAMGKDHVKAVVDMMKERNIAGYIGEDYYCLAHPSSLRTFKNDLETIHQHTPEGLMYIKNGEQGRYEGVRFVEQTFIPKGGAANSTTWDPETGTADAWDNAKSSWAYFFGEDTCAEGIACPEEMRAKLPGDYGRSKGVAWYYIGGFAIVHSNAQESRIVKWDSAA